MQIRESFANAPLNVSSLRTFVIRIGHSGSSEALEILKDVLSRPHAQEHLGDTWVEAVAEIGSSASRTVLLDLITVTGNELPKAAGWGNADRAAFHLANLFRENDAVRKTILSLEMSQLSPGGRDLLVRVLLQVGTEESLFGCLEALDSTGLNGYTAHKLNERFEQLFMNHVPVSDVSNAYQLSPKPANEFRMRLVELSQKEGPSRAAASRFLMQIELWRLEHGRPNGEARNPLFPREADWPPFCDSSTGISVV